MNAASNQNVVAAYLEHAQEMIQAITQEQIWTVISVLLDAWRARRTIFIMGNGGSAATASHFTNDLNKIASVPGLPRFKAIALTDNVPLLTAWGNDVAFEAIFAEQLLNLVEAGDIVVVLSTSGNSPNILAAVRCAREQAAITIGWTGQDGGALKQLVDHCVLIPSTSIAHQEDGHSILAHVIATALRQLIIADM